MERSPEQEAYRDFEYAVAFPGTSRTDITFALANADGEALTVAELKAHTDVTTTTVRKALARLEQMGLVEQGRKQGRAAFCLSEKGLLGLRAWQQERQRKSEAAARRPASTAALYRWRVSGVASRDADVDRRGLEGDLAEAGVELIAASRGELLALLGYEVDAADEDAALAAPERAGWRMQGMSCNVERTGLAARPPLRAGHELRFAEPDPTAVAASVRRAIAERVALFKDLGGSPSIWEDDEAAAEVVGDYVDLLKVPEDGRVPLPDDARLLAAVATLWEQLDDAGARAIGASFEISERTVRERFAGLEDHQLPTGSSVQELCKDALERYRRQGRLVP